jgi:Family of unknown function (DUF6518)
MSASLSGTDLRPSPTGHRLSLAWWAGCGVALVVGLFVGALTAYAQGWLSDGLGSLANSAGPWSLAAFLVALITRRPAVAAFWAAVVLASCEFGYAFATEIRGGSNAPSTVVFWLTAAVIAGPPLGVGGAWTRQGDWWFGASTGPAVLAGVLVGEAIYALSTIADTTRPAYWLVEFAVGVVIVVLAGVRIVSRDLRPRLAIPVCVVTTGLVAAVVSGTARLA